MWVGVGVEGWVGLSRALFVGLGVFQEALLVLDGVLVAMLLVDVFVIILARGLGLILWVRLSATLLAILLAIILWVVP